MGAVDTLGRLFLWKFSNLDRETCYRLIEVRFFIQASGI